MTIKVKLNPLQPIVSDEVLRFRLVQPGYLLIFDEVNPYRTFWGPVRNTYYAMHPVEYHKNIYIWLTPCLRISYMQGL